MAQESFPLIVVPVVNKAILAPFQNKFDVQKGSTSMLSWLEGKEAANMLDYGLKRIGHRHDVARFRT